MSEESGDAQPFEQHPLVEALVPDPAAGPLPSTVLVGFLGNSATPASRRLYLTAGLDEWVEIPAAEILYTRNLPDDQGTQVWVRRDLSLVHHRQSPEPLEAQFLTGSITQRMLP